AGAAIHSMAEKIQIASTSEQNNEPAEKRNEQWRDVQIAHRAIDRAGLEAPLYATDQVAAQMKRIVDTVQEVADKTEAFDPPRFSEESAKELLDEIEWLGEHLEEASRPLLREGRLHLGIAGAFFCRAPWVFFRSDVSVTPSSDAQADPENKTLAPRRA